MCSTSDCYRRAQVSQQDVAAAASLERKSYNFHRSTTQLQRGSRPSRVTTRKPFKSRDKAMKSFGFSEQEVSDDRDSERGHAASVSLLNPDDELLAVLVGRREPHESGTVSSGKEEEGESVCCPWVKYHEVNCSKGTVEYVKGKHIVSRADVRSRLFSDEESGTGQHCLARASPGTKVIYAVAARDADVVPTTLDGR